MPEAEDTTNETVETNETRRREAFMANWDQDRVKDQKESVDALATMAAAGSDAGDGVAKSDTSSGHPDSKGLQGTSEETPTGVAAKDLAMAMDEIHRAKTTLGLEPSAYKGKSEGELVELGNELNTLRRQRDREFTQAQGESSGGSSSDQVSEGEGPAESAGVGTQAKEPATPPIPELDLTSMEEETGEEAVQPIKDAFEALFKQNAALVARLDGDEQARQLAPIQEAADSVLAGLERKFPDLSKPETREDLFTLAATLGRLSPAKYDDMSPTDKVKATVADALRATYGADAVPEEKAPTVSPSRRTVTAPATGTRGGTSNEAKTPTERRAESFKRIASDPKVRKAMGW